MKFFIVALITMNLATSEVSGQCQHFQAVFSPPSICDNNGTPVDPSDDAFTSKAYAPICE